MELMIDSLLPVLLLIALGAGLSAFKVVDGDAWLGIERLAYYVLFPALLVGTIARTSLPLDTVLRVGGTLIATALAIAALTFALKGWLMGRAGVGGPAFTSVFQGSVRWNTFSALAIAGGLYGGAGTAIVAIAVACLIPVVNVLAVWVLSTYAAGKPLKPGAFIVTLAKNPFIWSVALGAAIQLMGDPVPKVLHTTMDIVGRAAIGIGLIMVGGGLQLQSLTRIDAPVVVAVGLRLVAAPTIALAIGVALGLDGVTLAAMMVCAGVPTASAAYVLARLMGGDAPLMARIVTLQTIVAFVTLPVVLIAAGALR